MGLTRGGEVVHVDGRALLPAQEAARLLGVSRRTLLRRVALGEVPAPVVVCGLRRWRAGDILAYIGRLR